MLFPWLSELEEDGHRGGMSCLSCHYYSSGHKTNAEETVPYLPIRVHVAELT